MYATISIEPSGQRYACKYAPHNRDVALKALDEMGGGVTLLRPQDDNNWTQLPEWEYLDGIGWVAD